MAAAPINMYRKLYKMVASLTRRSIRLPAAHSDARHFVLSAAYLGVKRCVQVGCPATACRLNKRVSALLVGLSVDGTRWAAPRATARTGIVVGYVHRDLVFPVFRFGFLIISLFQAAHAQRGAVDNRWAM